MASNVNAGIKARIIGSISGQDCIQVLHFGVNTPWNVDTVTVNGRLKELANAIKQCIVDVLLPGLSSDYFFHRVECQAIYPNLSDPVPNDAPVSVNGGGAVQGVNVAAQLINIRTGQGGRRGRGRNFWPPAGENVATGGAWEPAALAILAAFCACMAGKFIGPNPTTDFELGVYSRTIDNSIGQDFQDAFSKATEMLPQAAIATMGTRKMGKGS